MKDTFYFTLKVWGVFAYILLAMHMQSWRNVNQKYTTGLIMDWKKLFDICPSGFQDKTEDLLCKKPINFDPKYKNPCWFGENRELKCLPYFIVIGMQKSGTTDIYNALANHPEIVMPVKIHKTIETNKEFHFFDVNHYVDPKSLRYTSFDEYVHYFTPVARMLQENKTMQYITGEGTPDYFYLFTKWDMIPQNHNRTKPQFLLPSLIKKIIPDVKIILSLRKPEYRTLSNFYHYESRKEEFNMSSSMSSVTEFRKNTTEGLRNLRTCLETQGEDYCTTSEEMRPKFRYIYPGMYYVFMKEWLKYFSREQIHIINFESYREDKAKVLNKAFKFLKIREMNKSEMVEREVINNFIINEGVTLNTTYFKDTLDQLREFYKPYNARLKSLLKDYRSNIIDWY